MDKRRIYMNEFNLLIGKSTYLPFVSGILQAYAQTSEVVNSYYEFMPFNFHIDDSNTILEKIDRPYIAAFSVSMWNEQLSLKVARELKQRFPDCWIVFGGPQVPHKPAEYFQKYPFIDITVRGEGEESFKQILEVLAEKETMEEMPGVSWKAKDGEIHLSEEDRPFNRDLDIYPSPYLEGMYDNLMKSHPDFKFQAIIETNRGCPFKCTFCYWGMGGLRRKYRFHSLERVKAEIEWIAQNRIEYVFNADSNFGMHRRDEEIAQMLVDIKAKHGYPEKFRTCYGKNTDERIFEIGSLLHEHQLEKGITISYQSTDDQVQKNIKRDNIKLSVAQDLQRKFNEKNVPVYTELILGLPGESIDTWKAGIDRVLSAGLKNQLFLYICEILPNTDLADPEYQSLHGVDTMLVELTEPHANPREGSWVKEYEEIVVQTNTMNRDEWRKMQIFSWVTMLFHSLKVAFFIMAFLKREYGVAYSDVISFLSERHFQADKYPVLDSIHARLDGKIDQLCAGEGRGTLCPEWNTIYWEQEEASFFDVIENLDGFYDELLGVVCDFFQEKSIDYDIGLLTEVFVYQRSRMPRLECEEQTHLVFQYNLVDYFDNIFTSREMDVNKSEQQAVVSAINFQNDKSRFSREVVLWKRKNGNFINQIEKLSAIKVVAL